MTTNKISNISMMFVVSIAYLGINVVISFNILDFTYIIVLLVYYIKINTIRNSKMREWQTFSFII